MTEWEWVPEPGDSRFGGFWERWEGGKPENGRPFIVKEEYWTDDYRRRVIKRWEYVSTVST